MNDKKIPTFQTNDQPRFQQRDFRRKEQVNYNDLRPSRKGRDGKPNVNRDNAKFSKNRPHFEDKSRGATTPSQVTELTLHKSSDKEGKVNVWVKNSGKKTQPKAKKTGPLSPRAPEKIKKNRAEEMKVYGENACLALFEQRPDSIVRVWTTVNMAHKIGDILSYLAANKKVYHVVDAQELTLVSGTEHHGGICMLVKKSRALTLQGYLDVARKEDVLVLLDNVQNAQNIGGILRTCAYFGVKSVVVENADKLLSAAALRVAEGGAEYIRLLETPDNIQALAMLRQVGYQVVHVSTNKQARNLSQTILTSKIVFVLSEGQTTDLTEPQDTQVCLSQFPSIKNGLNIAVNAGILLAQWQQIQ